MTSKVFWFESLQDSERPNVSRGPEFQVASSSDFAQYGTVFRPVDASDLTLAETPGTVVIMLTVLAEEMLAQQIELPHQLMEMTTNRGVGAEAIYSIYPDLPSGCLVNGRAVLGLGWSFGGVQALVTITEGLWLALVCPADESPKLVTWP